MKNAIFIVFFLLLALALSSAAQGQVINNPPVVKAVEKSSSSGDVVTAEPKAQDPVSQAAAANAMSKDEKAPLVIAESSEVNSNAVTKSSIEAQKYYNAGIALYDAGKPNEAIIAFKETNRRKPNDPQTQYMMGMVYWETKAFEDSLDAFKRAVKLKPEWAEAYFRLGLTYYVLGRKPQANEAYKKLVDLESPLAYRLYRINNGTEPPAVVNQKAQPSNRQAEVVPTKPKQTTPIPIETKAVLTAAPGETSTAGLASAKDIRNSAVDKSNQPPPATSEPSPVIPSKPPAENATAGVKPIANLDSASSEAPGAEGSPLTDIYRVGPGDVLDIRLANSAANRSSLYTVSDGGVIDFPIAGKPLAVAGLTTKAIQARITSELKRRAIDDLTEVTVGVRQYNSHTVIVTGLLTNPGAKILRREAVPLYVLLAEVQPRNDAALASIMRGGVRTQIVELSDAAELNVIVRPGDVINLSARPQAFYFIGGRISNPGQKTFQSGITLVQAILAAGGVAHRNVVEISREGSDGRLTTTRFSLKEIKSGKIEDPRLQPGDRVEVLN